MFRLRFLQLLLNASKLLGLINLVFQLPDLGLALCIDGLLAAQVVGCLFDESLFASEPERERGVLLLHFEQVF